MPKDVLADHHIALCPAKYLSSMSSSEEAISGNFQEFPYIKTAGAIGIQFIIYFVFQVFLPVLYRTFTKLAFIICLALLYILNDTLSTS
jgi:hypothetical protein